MHQKLDIQTLTDIFVHTTNQQERLPKAGRFGSAAFVEAVTAEHPTTREAERDLPALRQFAPRPALTEILGTVKSIIDSDEKLARQAGMYLCHRYIGNL